MKSETKFTTFNQDQLLAYYKEDRDVLSKAYLKLKNLYQAVLEALKKAMVEKNYNECFRQAHTLRGMFGYFFAENLVDLCNRMERSAKKNDLESLQNLYQKVEQSIPKLIDDLAQIIGENDRKSKYEDIAS